MADLAERKVLDMVEQGHISAEEGLQLIKAMGKATKPAQESSLNAIDTTAFETVSDFYEPQPISQKLSEEEMRRIRQLKRWWVLPLGLGVLITTLSAIGMIYGYQAKGIGVGFWLASLPLAFGIFMIGLSIQTRRGVWLHVRIKQKSGETPSGLRSACLCQFPHSAPKKLFLGDFGAATISP